MWPEIINPFVSNFLHLTDAISKMHASVDLPTRKHPSPATALLMG